MKKGEVIYGLPGEPPIQLLVRLPAKLKATIAASAAEHRRSLVGEVVFALASHYGEEIPSKTEYHPRRGRPRKVREDELEAVPPQVG